MEGRGQKCVFPLLPFTSVHLLIQMTAWTLAGNNRMSVYLCMCGALHWRVSFNML